MSDFNITTVSGRLTRDAVLKELTSGTKVANFGIAINRVFGKDENRKEEVLFLDCEMFGNKADYFSAKTTKGGKVTLVGRLRGNSFENKDGQKVDKIVLNVDDFDIAQPKQTESDEKHQSPPTNTKVKTSKPANDKDIPF